MAPKYDKPITLSKTKNIAQDGYKVKSIEDIWKGQPTQDWAQMKYYSPAKLNHTDIANMCKKLDPTLEDDIIVIAQNRQTKNVYEYQPYAGRWVEQKTNAFIEHKVDVIRMKLERQIIQPIQKLMKGMGGDSDNDDKDDDDDEAKDEAQGLKQMLKKFNKLYTKMGDGCFKDSIVKQIINQAIYKSNEFGYSLAMFDAKKRYVGFNDGVYSFDEEQLLIGTKARELFITQSVGYEYADVENVDEETYQAYMTFITQIIPDPELRNYMFKRFNNAVKKNIEKLVLIFYDERGDNGKTVLLNLIKHVFGEYYIKCGNELIKKNGKNSNGEELSSLEKKTMACFSETDGTLNMALLKEIVGGDDISASGKWEKKKIFQSMVLPVILCNDIPALDTSKSAEFKKLRCIPFEAEFVHADAVDEARHRYLKDENITDQFEQWKYACMKHLLTLNNVDAPTPEKVMIHTKQLEARENDVLNFLDSNVEETEDIKLFVTGTDMFQAFKKWAKEEGLVMKVSKKADFMREAKKRLKPDSFREKTTIKARQYRNVFYGYQMTMECLMTADEDDYD